VVAACLNAGTASAAGYYSGNKGAKASGRAGAFAAKADDLTAVMYNPATLSGVNGTSVQLANRFSYNTHEFTRAPTLDYGAAAATPPLVSFETVTSSGFQALEPFLGVATDFGLTDWGFALSAYAPPGVANEALPTDGGSRYMMVSRDVLMVNYVGSAAWRFGDVFGLGVSAQWVAVPKIRYQLVVDATSAPASANPVSSQLDMLATVEGADPFTLNAIVGAWFRPAEFLEIGISGSVLPSNIEAEGTLSIDPIVDIGQSVNLVREDPLLGRLPADDVTLELPLPLIGRAGVRYIQRDGQREAWDIEFDVVYETWSRVERFTLDSNNLIGVYMGNDLRVGLINVEKQWQDTLAFQLGGDVAVIPDKLSLRAGAGYESAVAEPAYAHVDFPSGAHVAAGLGASVRFGALEVSLAYELRVQQQVEVSEAEGRIHQEVPGSACLAPYTDPNTCHPALIGQRSPVVNAGTYDATQHGATLDLRYGF
jgi:long-chain fatty acid transport protein